MAREGRRATSHSWSTNVRGSSRPLVVLQNSVCATDEHRERTRVSRRQPAGGHLCGREGRQRAAALMIKAEAPWCRVIKEKPAELEIFRNGKKSLEVKQQNPKSERQIRCCRGIRGKVDNASIVGTFVSFIQYIVSPCL